MSRSKPLSLGARPHNGSSRPSQKDPEPHQAPSPSASASADQENTTTQERNDIPPSPSMPLSTPRRVFVASLGNPKPYLNTLHSAGHLILAFIAQADKYPPPKSFAGGTLYEKNAEKFSYLTGYDKTGGAPLPTLWRSGAMMNVSGKAVKRAWTEWKKAQGLEGDANARLIIVHDELEKELGTVTVREDPKASARGHNGIKSMQAAFAGGERFVRIGVGIGRPASREQSDVSSYVLKAIGERELKAFKAASTSVMREIDEVVEGAKG